MVGGWFSLPAVDLPFAALNAVLTVYGMRMMTSAFQLVGFCREAPQNAVGMVPADLRLCDEYSPGLFQGGCTGTGSTTSLPVQCTVAVPVPVE